MRLKYFLCTSLLQIIIGLIFIFLSKNDIYFRYRPSNEDDTTSMLYHQVDEDLLSIVIIIESLLLFTSIILSIIAIWIWTSVGVNYHRVFIIKTCSFISIIEVILCVHFIIGTINFSQSLVSCDDFIFGNSLGCYIPIDRSR
jgi:Na+/melibiose symporter-like transporter